MHLHNIIFKWLSSYCIVITGGGLAIRVFWPQYHWVTLPKSQMHSSCKTTQEFAASGVVLPRRMGCFKSWENKRMQYKDAKGGFTPVNFWTGSISVLYLCHFVMPFSLIWIPLKIKESVLTDHCCFNKNGTGPILNVNLQAQLYIWKSILWGCGKQHKNTHSLSRAEYSEKTKSDSTRISLLLSDLWQKHWNATVRKTQRTLCINRQRERMKGLKHYAQRTGTKIDAVYSEMAFQEFPALHSVTDVPSVRVGTWKIIKVHCLVIWKCYYRIRRRKMAQQKLKYTPRVHINMHTQAYI